MNTKLLKEMCTVISPSGYEDDIRNLIVNEIKDFVDDVTIDNMGNIIGHKKGNGSKLMLSSYMDQIGLLVTFIDEHGFIRFGTLGTVEISDLIGQKVKFQNGTIGIIALENIENKSSKTLNNLYIDIGAINKKTAEKYVKIGDVCCFEGEVIIDNEKIITPAIGRIGAFVLVEIIKNIKEFKNDLYFVFNVQNFIDCTGAKASVYNVSPDFAVSFGITIGYNVPPFNVQKLPVNVGSGTCIKVKDASCICHPKIVDLLKNISEKNNVSYQFEIAENFRTELGPIHTFGKGVNASAISVPVRYFGKSNQLALINDIKESISLGNFLCKTEI